VPLKFKALTNKQFGSTNNLTSSLKPPVSPLNNLERERKQKKVGSSKLS